MTFVDVEGGTGTTVVLDVATVNPLESVVVYTMISVELDGEYGITEVFAVVMIDPTESVVV